MTVVQLTEEQFINLAETAVRDDSISSTSMAVLQSTQGTIIQSASGEYLLISK